MSALLGLTNQNPPFLSATELLIAVSILISPQGVMLSPKTALAVIRLYIDQSPL